MAKVHLATFKGHPALDVRWPDGIRSKIKIRAGQNGEELLLRIRLAILDGSWPAVRASLMVPAQQRSTTPGSFTAMADDYYKAWVLTHNKSTASKKGFLERFKQRFASVPPKAFHLLHVDRYVRWRQKAGVKNASINRELSALRHMFTWAVKRGYIEKNPIADMEKLQEQEWAGPKPTSEIVEAVFEKLDPRFVPVFVVIRETGARRGEVLSLQHWQIDRQERLITFAKRTKNGKNTVAPLTQRALEAIDSIPPLAGCPYVFYNPETGDRWHDARRPWEAARKAAGYPWLRVRDLRPAFGIEASELGAPMHYIQSALGHGSVAVTERYYAKYDPRSAARQLLKVIEGGRQQKKETGTKTGTWGE